MWHNNIPKTVTRRHHPSKKITGEGHSKQGNGDVTTVADTNTRTLNVWVRNNLIFHDTVLDEYSSEEVQE